MEFYKELSGSSSYRQHDNRCSGKVKGFACTSVTRTGRTIKPPRRFTGNRDSCDPSARESQWSSRSTVKRKVDKRSIDAYLRPDISTNRGGRSEATNRTDLAFAKVRRQALPLKTGYAIERRDDLTSYNSFRHPFSFSFPFSFRIYP